MRVALLVNAARPPVMLACPADVTMDEGGGPVIRAAPASHSAGGDGAAVLATS